MSKLTAVSNSTFKSDVLESDKPVLVDFWAPWCGPCKMLGPTVEKIAAARKSSTTFLAINTDESPELAAANQISGIPALVLFVNGREVDRIVGYVPETTILAMLDRHAA